MHTFQSRWWRDLRNKNVVFIPPPPPFNPERECRNVKNVHKENLKSQGNLNQWAMFANHANNFLTIWMPPKEIIYKFSLKYSKFVCTLLFLVWDTQWNKFMKGVNFFSLRPCDMNRRWAPVIDHQTRPILQVVQASNSIQNNDGYGHVIRPRYKSRVSYHFESGLLWEELDMKKLSYIW